MYSLKDLGFHRKTVNRFLVFFFFFIDRIIYKRVHGPNKLERFRDGRIK